MRIGKLVPNFGGKGPRAEGGRGEVNLPPVGALEHRRVGGFFMVLGSTLAHFWLPLAPFWLHFGSLLALFGSISAPFGSLLVSKSLKELYGTFPALFLETSPHTIACSAIFCFSNASIGSICRRDALNRPQSKPATHARIALPEMAVGLGVRR